MKCILYLLCLIVLYPDSGNAQGIEQFKRSIFIRQSDTLLYRMSYPANYDKNKSYPLLVFLHGSGSRGNDNESQLRSFPTALLNEKNREAYPCFIIAPQCPKDDTWVNFADFPRSLKATHTTAGQMVLQLIDELFSTFKIDSQRIYITGYSMGGEGTLDLLTQKPNLFAAAVAICPVADTATAALIKHNNIRIYHGSEDEVNQVQYSRIMVEALQAKGGKPLYTEYPGVGHQCWDKAYNEPDLLPWIFKQRRSK